MTERVSRHYWDANCFLSYINAYEGRVDTLEGLFARAKRGEIEIVTSVVSITEVAFAATEQVAHALLPEELARIDRMWADTSAVKLVEFHDQVARLARDLIRVGVPKGETGLQRRSIDAVHLATAKWMEVVECNTYERGTKWTRYAEHIGCIVREPFYEPPPDPPKQQTLFVV